MTTRQAIYSPANTDHFRWVGDWYEFDSVAAHKEARKARDTHAAELVKAGRKVKKFSLGKQLITRGGIGSGHPQIEMLVSCYGLNILD